LFFGCLSIIATNGILRDFKVFFAAFIAKRRAGLDQIHRSEISVKLSGNLVFTAYSELKHKISFGSGYY